MKQAFINEATAYGVTARYSGNQKKMFITGDDIKVKSFIRIICLRGKEAYPFSVGQSK